MDTYFFNFVFSTYNFWSIFCSSYIYMHLVNKVPRIETHFFVLFNSISLIPGLCKEGDNKRLCAMDPRSRLEDVHLQRVSSPGPIDQQASG